MNNPLLMGLVVVLVLVNVYFTYRRETGVDPTGRKILAALQLIYLVFIGAIFLLGYILNATGLTSGAKAASASSWVPFIVMVVVIIVLFAVVLVFKAKFEQKIREEHAIQK